MKEEAGGQVGGLEMREGGRRRLAGESRGWRCAGCGGKTNEEIIRECADGAEGAQARGALREEETVPEELRLGYRDEMGKSKEGRGERERAETGGSVDMAGPTASAADPTPASSHPGLPASTTAQTPPLPLTDTNSIANTPTTPLPSLPTIPTVSASVLFAPPPPRQPAAPTPTRTINIRPARPLHSPQRGSHAAAAVGAVPAWIDKAIVGVLVGLVLMVLRKVGWV